MKKWKLLFLTVLSLALVCASVSALATETPSCTHQYDQTATRTEPTCKDEGKVVYTCSNCKQVTKTESIPKLTGDSAHKWNEIVPEKPATCAAEGTKAKFQCTVCGTQKGGEVIAKLTGDSAHKWEQTAAKVEPTCTAAGSQPKYRCTVCGALKGGEVIAATGHDYFGQPIVTVKEATCKEAGQKGQKCRTCGKAVESTLTVIPKTNNHTWEVVEPARVGTCALAGKSALEKCTVCGLERGGVVESTKPACKPEDQSVIEKGYAATHAAPGKTDRLQCKVCGKQTGGVTIPQIAHDLTGEWKVEKEPTCKETGLKVKRCKDTSCNAIVEQQVLAVVACKETDKKLVEKGTPATHTEAGKSDLYQCQVCGKYYGGVTIPKLGHDKNIPWTDDPEHTATCTQAGKVIQKCSCGAVVGTKTKAKLGHDVSKAEWEVTKPATCAATGTRIKKCARCGEAGVTETIAKTACDASKLVEKEAAVAMTCETAGKTAVTQCPTCSKITGGQTIKASGHKTKDEITKAPTCTETGLKRVLCTNAWCNKKGVVAENVTVPATGHKGEWKVIEKPTPEKDGVSVKICSVCKAELDRKAVKYAEMYYNNTICAYGPCTRDLVGGKDWYRVTPIDLSVEGTFTYDLIASNKYTVGTATVTIANGTLTVTYRLNASQIQVTSEALIIYPNLEALRNPTPVNTRNYAYGQPIDIASTFGEDTKVILSVYLKADYNGIGAGVHGFMPNQSQIDEMTAIID